MLCFATMGSHDIIKVSASSGIINTRYMRDRDGLEWSGRAHRMVFNVNQ